MLPDKYADVKIDIQRLFIENKSTYGYRRILSLLIDIGHIINHKTVRMLMRELNLNVKVRKSKYKSYKGTVGKIAPNILNRNFKATAINQKWTTDITEFSVCNDKIYLSPIMDLYNREIVSYSISLSPNYNQIKEMLAGAFEKTKNTKGIIFHSDQGWQYQMKSYQRELTGKGIVQSMSRKGNCIDNACIENFFGRLKVEMFYGRTYTSVSEFIKALHEYMYYHNNKRISLKLKGMSPVQYRNHSIAS